MVGVPRSKACVNCKARRKGCDEKQPSCGQCLRRGVKCQGYPTELNFRFEDPGAKTRGVSNNRAIKSVQLVSTSQETEARGHLRVLSASCQRSAFRAQIDGLFFQQYLPHESGTWLRLETDLAVLPETTWLNVAACSPTTGPLLRDALAALTLNHVARSQHRPDFLQQSRTLYVKTIQGINKALVEADHSLDDQTLAAVMVLTIYEASNFKKPYFIGWQDFRGETQQGITTQAEGWFSHIRGAQALIKLRGKRNFSNPLSEKLFLGSRSAQLISAIGARRAIVEDTPWPSSHSETRASTNIRLFEILQGLPGLMELTDRMSPGPGEGVTEVMQSCYTTLLASLVDRSHQLRSELEDWLVRLESENQHHHQGQLYWPERSTLYTRLPESSPVRDLPFGYFFCFPNAEIAQQVVMFWTGSLLVHSNLWLAKRRLLEAGFNASLPWDVSSQNAGKRDSPLPAPFTQPIPPQALLIVQSSEYFVHPDMGFSGCDFIGFPMAVAQACLEHFRAPELAWYDVLFARMNEIKHGSSGLSNASIIDMNPFPSALRL